MQLQTIGDDSTRLFDMFTAMIREGRSLPASADGAGPSTPRLREPVAPLDLSGGRVVTVDGQPVNLPLGTGRTCTGAAIKAFARVYRGRILFIRHQEQWRRVDDDQTIDLSADDGPRAVHSVAFQTTPRLDVD